MLNNSLTRRLIIIAMMVPGNVYGATCEFVLKHERNSDSLAPALFRRPLLDHEQAAFGLMADGTHTSGDIRLGIQMALEAMLSVPQFLYRHELSEPNPTNPDLDGDGFELTSVEMAAFLSYTFTGSAAPGCCFP